MPFFFFNKLTVFDVQLFFSLETMALFLGNHVADIIHFPLEWLGILLPKLHTIYPAPYTRAIQCALTVWHMFRFWIAKNFMELNSSKNEISYLVISVSGIYPPLWKLALTTQYYFIISSIMYLWRSMCKVLNILSCLQS